MPPVGLSASFGFHTFCFSQPPNLLALISSSTRFLILTLLTRWAGSVFLGGVGGHPEHWKRFSKTPDLYPLDVNSNPSLNHDNQKHLQILPLLENHCSSKIMLQEGLTCIIATVCTPLQSYLHHTLQRSAATPGPLDAQKEN